MPRDETLPPEAEPPEAVRRAAETLLEGVGMEGAGAWRPLRGGRTNRVWRLERPRAPPLVVKLFSGAATPLFPNSAAAELRALRRLRGTGLAPGPVGAARTTLGPVLVMDHVAHPCPAAPEAAAQALARLHAQPPPPWLRRLESGPEGIRARLAAVARALRAPPPEALREAMRAPPPTAPPARAAFLHGDPTPGNALAFGKGRAVLIDWQCPARGDPCDDLAVLLSPAMRALDGLAPLEEGERALALAAYGDPATADRLEALASLHHALLAAHALWRAERGWPGAAEAAGLELEVLARRL